MSLAEALNYSPVTLALAYSNHSITQTEVSDDYELDVSDELIVLEDTQDQLHRLLTGNRSKRN